MVNKLFIYKLLNNKNKRDDKQDFIFNNIVIIICNK